MDGELGMTAPRMIAVDWSGQPPDTDSVTMYRIGFVGNAIPIFFPRTYKTGYP